MKNRNVIGKSISYVIAVIGAVIILLPFYITVITAFKTPEQSAQNFFSFPTSLNLDNFRSVFEKAGYFKYFMNSVIVTVSSLVLIYILVTMISYAIARSMKRSAYYKIIYGLIVLGMFVPFQVIMVPLVQFMGGLGLANKFGLILLHVTYAATPSGAPRRSCRRPWSWTSPGRCWRGSSSTTLLTSITIKSCNRADSRRDIFAPPGYPEAYFLPFCNGFVAIL